MGRHVMDLAAFLVEAHPQAFFWRNRSPTLTPSAADTRAKVKTISPSNARSRKPARLLVLIERSSSPASSAESVGGLAFRHRLSRRAQREDGGGMSRRAAPERFDISPSSAVRIAQCIIMMVQRVEALDVAIRQPESPRLGRSNGAQCAAAKAWILTDVNV